MPEYCEATPDIFSLNYGGKPIKVCPPSVETPCPYGIAGLNISWGGESDRTCPKGGLVEKSGLIKRIDKRTYEIIPVSSKPGSQPSP